MGPQHVLSSAGPGDPGLLAHSLPPLPASGLALLTLTFFSDKPDERERKDTGKSKECGVWSLQSWVSVQEESLTSYTLLL